jgi:hypothetical protein
MPAATRTEVNVTDAEQRAMKHLLDVESRDRQAFASSALFGGRSNDG